MKLLLIFIVFVSLGFCIGSLTMGEENEIPSAQWCKNLFFSQVVRTCQKKKLLYQKTVVSYHSNSEKREEIQNFILWDCKCKTHSQDFVFGEKEVSIAVRFLFNEPNLKPYFAVVSLGKNTWKAELKKEYFEKSELKSQTLQIQNRILRTITSYYSRSNFLYQVQTSISVYFSEQGVYQKHVIDWGIEVPLLNVRYKTTVLGKVFHWDE